MLRRVFELRRHGDVDVMKNCDHLSGAGVAAGGSRASLFAHYCSAFLAANSAAASNRPSSATAARPVRSSKYLLNSADLFLGTLRVCHVLDLKCFAR